MGFLPFSGDNSRRTIHHRMVIRPMEKYMNCHAFEITEDDVEQVLQKNWSRVANSLGKSFRDMAEALVPEIDHQRVEAAALKSGEDMEQTTGAHAEIVSILVEMGVLEAASSGDKSISDDDLCSSCKHCKYQPGELSSCELGWPGKEDEDGYVQSCASAHLRDEP